MSYQLLVPVHGKIRFTSIVLIALSGAEWNKLIFRMISRPTIIRHYKLYSEQKNEKNEKKREERTGTCNPSAEDSS